MARILTLSFNPALDLAIRLPSLVLGEVNRTDETHLDAAGKGVNVARVLVALGHDVTVSGFLGDANDGPFLRLFQSLGVDDAFLRVSGETRINAKVAESDGRVTDINGPGVCIQRSDWKRWTAWLDRLTDDPVRRPEAVVIAGSLPPGMTPEDQAGLIRRLRRQGLPVWVDTSGEALTQAIGAAPTAIKPNEHELADWAGVVLSDDTQRRSAARRLHRVGIEEALISAGEQGVLWVSDRGEYLAIPPVVPVASTVGAGDTFVAAMLHGVLSDHPPEQALGFATALAAESVRHVGVGNPHVGDIHQLQQQTCVRRFDDVDADGALA
ncbi:1-phosphofructokinase [Aidingimonas lacisalsi]|uniref:1-phosphofructokinase n=1 Tax=Aidingimonas lacisalsi TaxID=2604086 RepID=UPI0011D2B544|nr:1-phosphofructokinase [Aidingimonas lacisalsi]